MITVQGDIFDTHNTCFTYCTYAVGVYVYAIDW